MVWTLHQQQQQRGVQFPVRPNKERQPGESPQPSQQQGETELEQDERGEDAEQVPDAQAEQALGMVDGYEDEEDEPGRLDRND